VAALKINRLLGIVTILLNRETITAKELAHRFEVSTRTIYRDIEVLSASGIPVYKNRGNGGGIALLEDYALHKTLLSQSESESLLMAVETMAATNYPEADAVIEKIGSLFRSSQVHDWIEVNLEGWNSKTDEQDRFRRIRDAILGSDIISFDYVNSNGETSNRLVEPEKLLFSNSTWYLIAFCLQRNSQRLFRLSRIRNVLVTMQHFEQRETMEYEKQATHRAPMIELVLRCDKKILYKLDDTFDAEWIHENDDGSYRLNAIVPEEEWVYEFVLSLGSHAEVLEPTRLRKEIAKRIKDTLAKY